jgi:hypothetical protein
MDELLKNPQFKLVNIYMYNKFYYHVFKLYGMNIVIYDTTTNKDSIKLTFCKFHAKHDILKFTTDVETAFIFPNGFCFLTDKHLTLTITGDEIDGSYYEIVPMYNIKYLPSVDTILHKCRDINIKQYALCLNKYNKFLDLLFVFSTHITKGEKILSKNFVKSSRQLIKNVALITKKTSRMLTEYLKSDPHQDSINYVLCIGVLKNLTELKVNINILVEYLEECNSISDLNVQETKDNFDKKPINEYLKMTELYLSYF